MAKKKVAKKKVAKKKVAKKKVAKKKVAKKAAKKPAPKKAAPKKKKEVKKVDKEVKVEKLAPAPIKSNLDFVDSSPLESAPASDDTNLLDKDVNEEKSEPTKTPTPELNGLLSDEYNPDDEQEGNSFGYGWSYDEGLDSPEDVDKEDEPYDEDAEYANSGKPVGFDIDD